MMPGGGAWGVSAYKYHYLGYNHIPFDPNILAAKTYQVLTFFRIRHPIVVFQKSRKIGFNIFYELVIFYSFPSFRAAIERGNQR